MFPEDSGKEERIAMPPPPPRCGAGGSKRRRLHTGAGASVCEIDGVCGSEDQRRAAKDFAAWRTHSEGDSIADGSGGGDALESRQPTPQETAVVSSTDPPARDSDSVSASDCHPSSEDDTAGVAARPVRFSDVIGQNAAKLRLDEALLPLALPDDLVESVLTGIRASPSAILLYGPPGCGKVRCILFRFFSFCCSFCDFLTSKNSSWTKPDHYSISKLQTQLARAVAGESSSPLLSVTPSDVLSKYVGESERRIRSLFVDARRMSMLSPNRCAVLFFDEIDCLGGARAGMGGGRLGIGGDGGGANGGGGGDGSSRRILAELLIQLSRNFNGDDMEVDNGDGDEEEKDGDQDDHDAKVSELHELDREQVSEPRHISPASNAYSCSTGATAAPSLGRGIRAKRKKSRIIVLAATNRPEDCDPALLRRFAVRVHVAPPSALDRRKMLCRFLAKVEHSLNRSEIVAVARSTEGWSGSDLESLSREAVMAPVRECLVEAALLRARATKREQRSGTGSAETSDISTCSLRKVYSWDDDVARETLGCNSGRVPSSAATSNANPYSPEAEARESLIGSFRSLRPVILRDFEDALVFCLGGFHQDCHPSHPSGPMLQPPSRPNGLDCPRSGAGIASGGAEDPAAGLSKPSLWGHPLL